MTYTADHDNGYRATVEYSGGVAAVLPVLPHPPPPPGAGAGVAFPVAPTVTPLPFRAVPVSAVPSPVVRVSQRQTFQKGFVDHITQPNLRHYFVVCL